MQVAECAPLDRPRNVVRLPLDHATWLRVQDRRNRNIVVDVPLPKVYRERVPIFHTLWRTPNERVPNMKVAVTTEAITYARARKEPRVNEFLAEIAGFNDGKTRRIDLEEGDVLSTVLNDLRKAADAIGRGVKVAYDGTDTVKTARTFRFELRDKIVRQPKAKDASTPAAVPAPAPSGKGKKAA